MYHLDGTRTLCRNPYPAEGGDNRRGDDQAASRIEEERVEPHRGNTEPEVAAAMLRRTLGRVLVRCAICEQDSALVRSHDVADRLLAAHLLDCPGQGETADP